MPPPISLPIFHHFLATSNKRKHSKYKGLEHFLATFTSPQRLIPFIVKSENMFTARQGTKPHRRWRGLEPRPYVSV